MTLREQKTTAQLYIADIVQIIFDTSVQQALQQA